MRYVLLLSDDPGDWDNASDEQRRAVMDAHAAFDAAVRARGTLVAGEALAEAGSVRTLRAGPEGRVVSEGPYAETAEQLGGFYLVDVPDEATATELAQLLPASYTIQLWPVIDISGYDYGDRH